MRSTYIYFIIFLVLAISSKSFVVVSSFELLKIEGKILNSFFSSLVKVMDVYNHNVGLHSFQNPSYLESHPCHQLFINFVKWIFNDSYSKEIAPVIQIKLSKPVFILIGRLSQHQVVIKPTNVFITFYYQTKFHNSIFIYVPGVSNRSAVTKSDLLKIEHTNFVPFEKNSAPIKLIAPLLIPADSSTKDGLYYVICNNYCTATQTDDILTVIKNRLDLDNLHKHLFSQANNRKILAPILVTNTNYFRQFRYRYACKYFRGIRKIWTFYCNSNIMTIISMSEIHNTSFVILNRGNGKEVNLVDFSENGEYVKGSLTARQYPTTYNIQFDIVITQWPIYCLQKQANKTPKILNIHVWIDALHWSIWIIFSILILFSIWVVERLRLRETYKPCNENLFIQQFLIFISALTGQSIKLMERFKMYTMLGVCCVVFSHLYGNSITSLVVLPTAPTSFQTIKQLINHNYKILWSRHVQGMLEPDVAYKHDFAYYGINITNHTFHKINTSLTNLIQVADYLVGRYAYLKDNIGFASAAKLIAFYANKKEEVSGGINCFRIPQSVSMLARFWDVQTVHGKWLRITIRRTQEAGLSNEWDNFADWMFMGYYKIRGNDTLKSINDLFQNDRIDSPMFLPIVICWSLMVVLNAVVFCVEIGRENVNLTDMCRCPIFTTSTKVKSYE